MALTYTVVAKEVAGNSRAHYVQFTTDNTYAAGGYALAAADFETFLSPSYNTTTSVTAFISETNKSGYRVALDKANSKLVVFAPGAEATTTTSTQVVTARVTYGTFWK